MSDNRRMTVGDIRREIGGLPDDAPVFVTVFDGWDLDITDCWQAAQVIDPPDAEGPPWPTRPGLELHAGFIEDADGDAARVVATVKRALPLTAAHLSVGGPE